MVEYIDNGLGAILAMEEDCLEMENMMEDRDYEEWLLDKLKEMQVEEPMVNMVLSEARMTVSDENLENLLYRTEHPYISNKF